MTTPYHAQYWAWALSVSGAPDSVEHLARTIANARVDLNPHQVDAALFALRSPLSKGVILADEVGLGKTIEAALVISQRWAERRRHILVVVPAALRTQWQHELWEKFFLPSTVLERRSWTRLMAEGSPNPFDLDAQVIICSYQFAARNQEAVSAVPWDLAVIDEAHRLRNVYKQGNKTAKALAAGLEAAPKLLLTATPLQNSLMELYGLASVIDPHLFGDPTSFREQFVRETDDARRNAALKARLAEVCQRTLRKQVLEYVRFTQRVPLTQEFSPTDAEHALYEDVSEYLRRDTLYAIPQAQRPLMTMVLRKLLASSSFAIAATLAALVSRLREVAAAGARARAASAPLVDVLEPDFETLDELEDDWESGETRQDDDTLDAALLADETRFLEDCLARATSIDANAKGEALLRALSQAFEQIEGLGAARKAVVFTESRRTQDYLYELLTAHGYAGQVVMLNGSNTHESARRVHAEWLIRHADDGLPTGARAVDVRAALTEAFRDDATILLATEAAAEGVNLQFCSLVFNYDLPWNPQRVEQRIGRCHRYGQAHDVVVVNFVNQRNAADRRVLDLLSEKFRLFEGVFGASDEILGAVESGVDIERRIAAIYQDCRTQDAIALAFDALRAELETEIASQMRETRQHLLDHFDEDVHARLRVHRDRAQQSLDERGRMLLKLTRFELRGDIDSAEDSPKFFYAGDLSRQGWYCLDWKQAEAERLTFYRPDHPLALAVIERARARELPCRHLAFDYAGYGATVTVLEPQRGQSGWLTMAVLTVRSVVTEEFLVLTGITDQGEPLDDAWCRRLLRLWAQNLGDAGAAPDLDEALAREVRRELDGVEARNSRTFDAEVQKLDRWSDDLKSGLERELRELDAGIHAMRRQAAAVVTLADKLAAQRETQTLEKRRNRKRRDLYEAQDRIDAERSGLIEGIERQLATTFDTRPLFTIRWTLR